MVEIIMYDFIKFRDFLKENVLNEDVRKKLITAGAVFDNEEYSITKLGPGKMRSGNPTISLTRNEDGTHTLTKDGETPIIVDGPKSILTPKID